MDSVADLGAFVDAELKYYDRCRDVLMQLKQNWPAGYDSTITRLTVYKLTQRLGRLKLMVETITGNLGHAQIPHMRTKIDTTPLKKNLLPWDNGQPFALHVQRLPMFLLLTLLEKKRTDTNSAHHGLAWTVQQPLKVQHSSIGMLRLHSDCQGFQVTISQSEISEHSCALYPE